jgi:hypothetical protein
MANLKNTTINDTGYFMPPSGTTAQRPASPSVGMIRYNSTTNYLEFYDGTSWINIAGKGNVAAPSNLLVYLDAGISSSYPGSGFTWYDLSGAGRNFNIDNSASFAYDSTNKWFNMGGQAGINYESTIPTGTDCTCVFIMKTTDSQALFWMSSTGGNSYYLGAYSGSNSYYNGNVSVSGIFRNAVSIPNLSGYVPTGNMMMVEFKGVNFTSPNWPTFTFNKYPGFSFDNGAIAALLIYNKSLSTAESTQNLTYFGGRYGF